jgi:hypothetical protein
MTWNSRPCDRSMWLPDPAHSVRGPKYVVKKGKTPVEPRRCQNAAGFNSKGFGVRFYRTWTLIAAMFYSFACVSAVLKRIFYSARFIVEARPLLKEIVDST